MTLVLSTSSPQTSVAVLDEGKVRWSDQQWAPRQAGQAIIDMLTVAKVNLSTFQMFVADTGPGSLTGIRVGVVMAKIWAYRYGVSAGAVSAFDLFREAAVVALPERKGQWCIREGTSIRVVDSFDPSWLGYGHDGEQQTYPEARCARGESIQPVSPWDLAPNYLAEPSISQPNPIGTNIG
jgi:hypothetical protein